MDMQNWLVEKLGYSDYDIEDLPTDKELCIEMKCVLTYLKMMNANEEERSIVWGEGADNCYRNSNDLYFENGVIMDIISAYRVRQENKRKKSNFDSFYSFTKPATVRDDNPCSQKMVCPLKKVIANVHHFGSITSSEDMESLCKYYLD